MRIISSSFFICLIVMRAGEQKRKEKKHSQRQIPLPFFDLLFNLKKNAK